MELIKEEKGEVEDVTSDIVKVITTGDVNPGEVVSEVIPCEVLEVIPVEVVSEVIRGEVVSEVIPSDTVKVITTGEVIPVEVITTGDKKVMNVVRLEKIKNINKRLFKRDKKNIIFVYSPPKVGSTSLVSSLRLNLSENYNIIHIHDEIMIGVLIKTDMEDITMSDIINYNEELGKNVFVMDIFRNPIERKISEYFEKLSSLHFNNTELNLNKYRMEKIIDRFNKVFEHISKDDYFFERYNIECPDHFDVENKYLLIENKGTKYIKLRMNDIDEWNVILTKIFKSNIVTVKDHETKNKSIGELYERFKKEYRIPYRHYLKIKESNCLKYYYSKEERENYLKSWEHKTEKKEITCYTKKEYDFYLNVCIENKYYNNNIEWDHYIDNGCLCMFCSKKRKEIVKKLKSGMKTINEKIIHDNELLKREIGLRMSISKPKKIIKNNLNNIVYL